MIKKNNQQFNKQLNQRKKKSNSCKLLCTNKYENKNVSIPKKNSLGGEINPQKQQTHQIHHKNIGNLNPEFVLREMERNVKYLKDIYRCNLMDQNFSNDVDNKQNISILNRKCNSSLGYPRNSQNLIQLEQVSNIPKKISKQYQSCRQSPNAISIQSNCITFKKKKTMDVIPSVPKGSNIHPIMQNKEDKSENYKKSKSKKMNMIPKKSQNNIRLVKNSKQVDGKSSEIIKKTQNSNNQYKKNKAQIYHKIDKTYEFYKRNFDSKLEKQYNCSKFSQINKTDSCAISIDKKNKNTCNNEQKYQSKTKVSEMINKEIHKKSKCKIKSKSNKQNSKKNIKVKNIKTPLNRSGQQQYENSNKNSNKHSSTRVHATSSSIISRSNNNSREQLTTDLPINANLVNQISQIKKDHNKWNLEEDGNQNFLSCIPEIQVSMFDKNLPILEVEDSKEQMSSVVLQPYRNAQKCNSHLSDGSLEGCQIAKITDQDSLNNFQLISISL